MIISSLKSFGQSYIRLKSPVAWGVLPNRYTISANKHQILNGPLSMN